MIMTPTLKARADTVVQLIDVAQKLADLNNFNGFVALKTELCSM